MGLQRVRRYAGIVAPDLAEQGLAADHFLAGAVEIFQDRRLFLGQPDFAFGGIDQNLGSGLKRIVPDREHRILALFVLTQLRAQPGQQHIEAERFGDVIVGAGIEAENFVGIGVVPGQHDDRRLDAVAPHQPADLTTIHIGQTDIKHDGIEIILFGRLERRRRAVRRHGGELFMQLELLAQRFAQCIVIVDEKYFFAC